MKVGPGLSFWIFTSSIAYVRLAFNAFDLRKAEMSSYEFTDGERSISR
jgi:hypothetical protein